MSAKNGFIIRDGVASDIEACLAIDHVYETRFVWQLNMHGITEQRQITLRKEQLPRTIEVEYPKSKQNLVASLQAEHCFLVAEHRTSKEILGYLCMTSNAIYPYAHIHDVIVDKAIRDSGISSRLVAIGRRWAIEQDMQRLFFETQTKNDPAIELCNQMGFTFAGYNDQYFANHDIALFFVQNLD